MSWEPQDDLPPWCREHSPVRVVEEWSALEGVEWLCEECGRALDWDDVKDLIGDGGELMSDDRRAQARVEAVRRYPPRHGVRLAYTAHQVDKHIASAFVSGAMWADANPQPADGSTSDGYHTFDELYEYRMLYNAHAAHGWLAAGIPVVKSWRHSDGEACFGGGWFIVTASLPAGQVSNHYEARHWGLFKVPEVDLPPEWDGHTPHDAAMRLRAEAEHARPQPRTITHDDMGAAYAAFMEDEGHPVRRLIEALSSLGIEVTDDE